jgi:hypothetical protein
MAGAGAEAGPGEKSGTGSSHGGATGQRIRRGVRAMSTVQAFAATATLTGESACDIKPEYASMAVVWVPESARGSAANDEASGIDAWACQRFRSARVRGLARIPGRGGAAAGVAGRDALPAGFRPGQMNDRAGSIRQCHQPGGIQNEASTCVFVRRSCVRHILCDFSVRIGVRRQPVGAEVNRFGRHDAFPAGVDRQRAGSPAPCRKPRNAAPTCWRRAWR